MIVAALVSPGRQCCLASSEFVCFGPFIIGIKSRAGLLINTALIFHIFPVILFCMSGRILNALIVFVVGLLSFYPCNLKAQVQGSAIATNSYNYRGVSISNGQPSIGLNIGYDAGSGAYGGVSILGQSTNKAGPQILGGIEYVGYTSKIRNQINIDVGINSFQYKRYYNISPKKYRYVYSKATYGRRIADSRQIYLGILSRNIGLYNYYSADYFGGVGGALYSEAYAAVHPTPRLRLFVDFGALTPLGSHVELGPRDEEFDLRAGAAAELKHTEVQIAWTTRRPNRDRLGQFSQSRDTLVIAASWFF